MQELTTLKNTVNFWTGLSTKLESLIELIELALSENDFSISSVVASDIEEIKNNLEQEEFKLLLSGVYDIRPAILSIHAGAGGTDSQDWAEMLFKMYSGWCQLHARPIQILNTAYGEDAGFRSVTLQIGGDFAFGYLEKENGVHRLVRQSPFDPSNARHTSFAVVEVIPMASESSDPPIRAEDIKMDAFRSSGPGGQNVQKVASAVRLTHLPSGIVVSCQTERSQFQNREYAMRLLSSRLLALEKERKERELAELRGERISPEWGNQIRSYVLHPYKQVKDHRTNFTSSDPVTVLEGHIDDFIKSSMVQMLGEASQ
jgi:peptide chain release factor 2